jgi:hypothetical protein
MAKMILYAMNYGVTVEGGQWPAAVMGKADDLDIFDKVNAVPNVPALRGDVVKMIDNSLTINHLVQKGYGDLAYYDEGDDTFLSKLKVKELEDVFVTDIARVNNKLDDNEIELTQYDKNGKVVDSDVYTLIADITPEVLFGLEVKAWVNDDDEIFFVDIVTDEKDILFDTVDIDGVDVEKEIKLLDADKKYKWADDAIVYVNFEEVDYDEIPDNAYGKIVLDRGYITFASLFDFDKVGVVTEVDDDVITFVNSASADEDDLNLDNYDYVYAYNPDFSKADVEDIDEDYAIFFWEGDDDDLYIIVKDEVVSGEVSKITSDKIKVDGKEYKKGAYAIYTLDEGDNYKAWTTANQAEFEDFIDEEVKVILDLRGQVLLVTGDAETKSGWLYGVVTYAESGRKVTLTIFNQDGEEVEYQAEKGLTLANFGLSDVEFTSTDYAVIKFKVNSDGEIEDGDFVIVPNNYTTGKSNVFAGELSKNSDSKAFTLGNSNTKYYLTNNTVVIKAVDPVDGLDPEVLSVEKLISNGVTKGTDTQAIVFVKAGTNDVQFVVFTNANFQAVGEDVLYGVVVDGYWKEGSNYYAEINVFGEGSKVYKVKEAEKGSFANGSVVAFKLNNNDEAVIIRGSARSTTITGYDDGYLNGSIKVDGSAVVYTLKDNGKVDKKVSASRFNDYVGRSIAYVVDEDGVLVTAAISAATATTPATITFTTTDEDTLTVSNVAYRADGKNEYVVRISGGALTGTVYSDPVTLTASGATLTFDIDGYIPANGIYKVELVNTENFNKAIATAEIFLKKN